MFWQILNSDALVVTAGAFKLISMIKGLTLMSSGEFQIKVSL
jgi:hypothetical protein